MFVRMYVCRYVSVGKHIYTQHVHIQTYTYAHIHLVSICTYLYNIYGNVCSISLSLSWAQGASKTPRAKRPAHATGFCRRERRDHESPICPPPSLSLALSPIKPRQSLLRSFPARPDPAAGCATSHVYKRCLRCVQSIEALCCKVSRLVQHVGTPTCLHQQAKQHAMCFFRVSQNMFLVRSPKLSDEHVQVGALCICTCTNKCDGVSEAEGVSGSDLYPHDHEPSMFWLGSQLFSCTMGARGRLGTLSVSIP